MTTRFVLALLLVAVAVVCVHGQDEGGAPKAPSWILPLAPAGYGGPGVINPYSNVNPLNPMAAQMEAQAAGKAMTQSPQQKLGPAASAPAEEAEEGEFIETGETLTTKMLSSNSKPRPMMRAVKLISEETMKAQELDTTSMIEVSGCDNCQLLQQ